VVSSRAGRLKRGGCTNLYVSVFADTWDLLRILGSWSIRVRIFLFWSIGVQDLFVLAVSAPVSMDTVCP